MSDAVSFWKSQAALQTAGCSFRFTFQTRMTFNSVGGQRQWCINRSNNHTHTQRCPSLILIMQFHGDDSVNVTELAAYIRSQFENMMCIYVCVCISLYQLSWRRINDRRRGTTEGRSKREMIAGWEVKGEETQRGKLSLICLSRGIFGLPLAINLVTSLHSDRGMSAMGGAYVCVFKCQCVYECTDMFNSLRGSKFPKRVAWKSHIDILWFGSCYFVHAGSVDRHLEYQRAIIMFFITPMSKSSKNTCCTEGLRANQNKFTFVWWYECLHVCIN